MSRVIVFIACSIFLLIASMGWAVNHYRDNATEQLGLANDTISDMQVRQRDVAALDAKYTGELADAKANIDQLERDVAAGKRRLQVSARCPANGTTSPPRPG